MVVFDLVLVVFGYVLSLGLDVAVVYIHGALLFAILLLCWLMFIVAGGLIVIWLFYVITVWFWVFFQFELCGWAG